MRFRIRQLALVSAIGLSVVARADVPTGPIPESVAPAPVSVPAATIAPEADASKPVTVESRSLGKLDHPAASARPNSQAGSQRTTISPSGVVGSLSLVLLLIALLSGVVVLGAKFRGKLGGAGGLSAALGAGGRSPAGILEVLGRYPLARGLTLVLLKVDRRILLLAQSRLGRFGGLTLTPICELDSAEDVASVLLNVREADKTSLTNRFASIFSALDREAADKVEGADGKVLTTLSPEPHPPRRAAHKPVAESTAAAADSIRHRLEALRTPAARRGGRA